jgi:hypothetical protein
MNFMARSKKCDRAGAQEKSWHDDKCSEERARKNGESE